MGILIIPDGFTLKGKVDAIPGLMREVRFDYRPGGFKARCKLNSAFKPEQKEQAVYEIVTANTANWKVINDDGTPEPVIVNAELLAGIPSLVVEIALEYIMGGIGPNLDVEAGK